MPGIRRPPASHNGTEQSSGFGNLFDQVKQGVTDAVKSAASSVSEAPPTLASWVTPEPYVPPGPTASRVAPNVALNRSMPSSWSLTQDAQAEDQAKILGIEGRTDRMRTLGINDGDQVTELPEGNRLTTAEYEALNPRERQAIDFNSMLRGAVKRDTRKQDEYKPTAEQSKNYDAAVVSMFGKDGASDSGFYAPETMAVLRQLKIDDDLGDIDDYLGLKVAIKDSDLPLLNAVNKGGGLEGTPEILQQNVELKTMLAESTKPVIADALASGAQLLQNFRLTARGARTTDIADMGGIAGQKYAKGFGPESDSDFTLFSNFLGAAKMRPPEELATGLAAAKAELSPQQFDALTYYLQTNGLDIGADVNKKTKIENPREFWSSLEPVKPKAPRTPGAPVASTPAGGSSV